MERHLQSAVQILLLAVLIWVGTTVVDVRDQSKIVRSEITEIKSQISAMNSRFDQYLPRNEAVAKFEAEMSKHQEIDRRLNSLEATRRAR